MRPRRKCVLCWLVCVCSQLAAQGQSRLPAEHDAPGALLLRQLASQPERFDLHIAQAEWLLRQNQVANSSLELVRAISLAQELGDATLPQQLHCHELLMQIADAQNDDYSRDLHRGIGLYILAVQRSKLPDPNGQLPMEGLLCRAANKLSNASVQRPEEAQPCWYLQRVWAALGKMTQAARWLHRADAAAPFSYLTPSELRGLQLAIRASDVRRF